ncbi:MAG: GAF domain-containing protein [Candidatus Krumholzibacteria bacterium]|nr:GAF domain-containing protein [Candidatus Krumholzibacteria bacterium]
MSEILSIVLGAPGEAELPLLADLGNRDDLDILAVVDPIAKALGSAIAQIMGLPVVDRLAAVALPADRSALLVLPAGPASLVAELAATAAEHGWPTIGAEELRARLFAGRARQPERMRGGGDRPELAEIERESNAIQAALSDLEEALAGDTILRRLLDLAARAVGASGGSIMLFDDASRELYIAYATGLSEGTLHGTRVKLGEGIAGRVARTRRAELVKGYHGAADRRRDRPDIASAVCTPLIADDHLLGVLNISTQSGQTPLDEAARDLLLGLSVRLSRILHGVQQLQQQRTSRMFDLTEQQLRRLGAGETDFKSMLTAWCAAIAVTADAQRVSLVIPCDDGGLLVCENSVDGRGNDWYEPLRDPAWVEVLTTGLPLVARQTDVAAGELAPVTIFYLPVGRDPVRAGLAVRFDHARTAHAFHAMAGEMVFLLERLLADQLDQRRQAVRANRLAALSTALTALTTCDSTPGRAGERLCDAAARLTGARYVAAVANLSTTPARLAGGNVPEAAAWFADLPRLLRGAARDGWHITTLATGDKPLSVLAAVSRTGEPAPGLVLVGKQSLYELDGQVFSELDAELILPLAATLGQIVAASDAAPRKSWTPADTAPLAAKPWTASAAANEAEPAADTAALRLLADLRCELDRCDRYHNVCGLILLRPSLPVCDALDLLQAAARRLSTHLRNSDRLYPLADGVLAVLVPEDVQRLDRVQVRLQAALRDLAGDPQLAIATARVAYPAHEGTAATLLACARSRLDA